MTRVRRKRQNGRGCGRNVDLERAHGCALPERGNIHDEPCRGLQADAPAVYICVPYLGTKVNPYVPMMGTKSHCMANNLRALREGRSWSQEHAAQALGTTRNQYAKLEGGSRRLSDVWISRAAAAFGVDAGEVVTDKRSLVPVAGFVGAGSEAHLYGDSQGPLDEVTAPEGATPQTIAVEVRGDSLGSFFDGWLVFYDDVRSPVTDDLLGRLCVVGLADGRVLVKMIRQSRTDRGLFDLHGQFSDPVLDVAIVWAAPVKSIVPR